MTTPELVGGRLAEARRRLGLSQEAVAERSGVAGTTITRWERGDGLAPIVKFGEACRELGVDPGEILDADRAPPDAVEQQIRRIVVALRDLASLTSEGAAVLGAYLQHVRQMSDMVKQSPPTD